MHPISDRFRDALTRSHRVLHRADVYRAGELIAGGLPVLGGQVTVDKNAATRRHCSVTIVDPDGTLTPRTGFDALAPYGNEIRLYRGIALPAVGVDTPGQVVVIPGQPAGMTAGMTAGLAGTASTTLTLAPSNYTPPADELVPLGVFGLATARWSDDGARTLTLTAYDRSRAVARALFEDPYLIGAGQNTATAIADLLTDRYPTVRFGEWHETTEVTPLAVLDAGMDPWAEAQKMAQAIGCELFFDAEGRATLRPEPDPSAQPAVWRYADGANATILPGLGKEFDSDDGWNGVVVTGESVSGAAPVRAVAWDEDPHSPTYYQGPYGRVPKFETSPYVVTAAAALAAAKASLQRNAGGTERVTFTAIPNPAHDAGDVVHVARDDVASDVCVIEILTVPLEVTGVMTVQTRQRRTGAGSVIAAASVVVITPAPPPVAGVPGAPANVTLLSSTASSATVGWDPPASDGGSVITGYWVYGYEPGASPATPGPGVFNPEYSEFFTVAAMIDPFVFTNIINDGLHAYIFSLAAANANGVGPRSSVTLGSTEPDPEEPPPAPGLPAAPAVANGGITSTTFNLDWAVPYDGGSPIDGYYFYAFDAAQTPGVQGAPGVFNPEWVSELTAAPADPYQFTNLSPERTYRFGVAAHNANGTGPKATINATTPAAPSGGGGGGAPITSGLPAKPVALYWEYYATVRRLVDWSQQYNMLMLFQCEPNGTGENQGRIKLMRPTDPAVDAAYNADIATCLARGQKCMLTIGGAGAQVYINSELSADNFIADVKTINASIGGTQSSPQLSGVDYNSFETQVAHGGWLSYASLALKTYFGSNFIISSPVAIHDRQVGGQAWNDRQAVAEMHYRGAVDWIAPQFYDGGGNNTQSVVSMLLDYYNEPLTLTIDGVSRNVQIPRNKLGIGFGIDQGQNPTWWTAASARSCYVAMENAGKTPRGGFCFSGQSDPNQSFIGNGSTTGVAPVILD